MRYRIEGLFNLPEYFKFLRQAVVCIAIAVFLLSSGVSKAQHEKIDSLDRVLETQAGIEKFETLINKVRAYVTWDTEAALSAAESAYALALEAGDSARIVQGGRVRGQVLGKMDRRKEAIQILGFVLPIAERHNYRHDLKLILNNLAGGYNFLGDHDRSLELHLRSLAIAEEDGDLENMGFSLNNIGTVYVKMKNFNEAKSYYERALEIQMKGDRFEIGILLTNLGNCYNALGQYEKALKTYQQAFDECNGRCIPHVLMDGHLGIGISNFNLQRYADAREHFDKALNVALVEKNLRHQAHIYNWLGKYQMHKENIAAAIDAFKNAEVAGSAGGFNDPLIDTYKRLAEIYDLQGDHLNFSAYIKKYVALKDTIFNEEVMQSLAKSKADYEQRVNLATIKANEMTIAQQKRLYTASLVIAGMAVMMVIGLFVAYRTVKGVNVKLSLAQDVIFEQNRKLGIRNEELDRLVEKKTEELKLVNLSLKQMNDELDTFIHKSAEDIRAPLASLMGICHVALLDIKDQASLMYMEKISKTTELLNSILKRLLALNKINHSKPSLAETDLQTLVDQVIAIQRKKGLPENLIVRRNIVQNASLFTDRELMSIVLENTIDNALKFCNTSINREHFIEINVMPSNNGRVSVKVVDNRDDVGDIDSADLFHIFHGSEFESGEAGSKQDLYFVKTAAKKIGGKVDVKKTPEGYNELTLVF